MSAVALSVGHGLFWETRRGKDCPFLWHLFLSSLYRSCLVRPFLMWPDTELTETAKHGKARRAACLFSTCILGHALPSCLRPGSLSGSIQGVFPQ